MINFDKHTIRFRGGDIDINIIPNEDGIPVIAFSNSGEGIDRDSLFMGFDSGETIDGLISILRSFRRDYYPEKRKSTFDSTQRFDFG